MRYFQKVSPGVPLYTKGGRALRFEVGANDNQVGFLATENAALIGEIETAMKRGVGGITEIDQAAYDDGLKKKTESMTSSRSWSALQALNTAVKPPQQPTPSPQPPVAPAAVVVNPAAISEVAPTAPPTQPVAPKPTAPPGEFRPKAVKRKQ